MLLSPDEIAGKEFVTVLRGYDPEEVRPFLERAATDLRRLLVALYSAGEAVEQQDPDLAHLLRHAEQTSESVAALAREGRAAKIDAAWIRHDAEQIAHTEQDEARRARLGAVREAAAILQRARDEAAVIVRQAEQERAERLDDLRRLDSVLARVADETTVLRRALRPGSATTDSSDPAVGPMVDG
jgi:DivIVA domain-containing protein